MTRESKPPGRDARGGSEELAAGLRSGSPEAVRALRRRVRRVIGFRGYRIPAEDRRDLEQEVMRQVWQAVNRSRFDPELGFRKFVEVVTARRCIDWLRARREQVELPPELASGDSPLRLTLARERRRLAYDVLARLDKPCRELIYLRVGLGKGYREMSRLLGRSPGALRVQMHRCLARARRMLAAETEAVRGAGDGARGRG